MEAVIEWRKHGGDGGQKKPEQMAVELSQEGQGPGAGQEGRRQKHSLPAGREGLRFLTLSMKLGASLHIHPQLGTQALRIPAGWLGGHSTPLCPANSC